MTTVMIRHRVPDFDMWKIEYDPIFEGPLSAAVKSTEFAWKGRPRAGDP